MSETEIVKNLNSILQNEKYQIIESKVNAKGQITLTIAMPSVMLSEFIKTVLHKIFPPTPTHIVRNPNKTYTTALDNDIYKWVFDESDLNLYFKSQTKSDNLLKTGYHSFKWDPAGRDAWRLCFENTSNEERFQVLVAQFANNTEAGFGLGKFSNLNSLLESYEAEMAWNKDSPEIKSYYEKYYNYIALFIRYLKRYQKLITLAYDAGITPNLNFDPDNQANETQLKEYIAKCLKSLVYLKNSIDEENRKAWREAFTSMDEATQSTINSHYNDVIHLQGLVATFSKNPLPIKTCTSNGMHQYVVNTLKQAFYTESLNDDARRNWFTLFMKLEPPEKEDVLFAHYSNGALQDLKLAYPNWITQKVGTLIKSQEQANDEINTFLITVENIEYQNLSENYNELEYIYQLISQTEHEKLEPEKLSISDLHEAVLTILKAIKYREIANDQYAQHQTVWRTAFERLATPANKIDVLESQCEADPKNLTQLSTAYSHYPDDQQTLAKTQIELIKLVLARYALTITFKAIDHSKATLELLAYDNKNVPSTNAFVFFALKIPDKEKNIIKHMKNLELYLLNGLPGIKIEEHSRGDKCIIFKINAANTAAMVTDRIFSEDSGHRQNRSMGISIPANSSKRCTIM